MLRVDELVAECGYPRGSIGPVGARRPARVLLDRELAGEQRLLVGAGDEGWVYPIAGARLLEETWVSLSDIHDE